MENTKKLPRAAMSAWAMMEPSATATRLPI